MKAILVVHNWLSFVSGCGLVWSVVTKNIKSFVKVVVFVFEAQLFCKFLLLLFFHVYFWQQSVVLLPGLWSMITLVGCFPFSADGFAGTVTQRIGLEEQCWPIMITFWYEGSYFGVLFVFMLCESCYRRVWIFLHLSKTIIFMTTASCVFCSCHCFQVTYWLLLIKSWAWILYQISESHSILNSHLYPSYTYPNDSKNYD
jgi:hypothetical protein